MPKEEIKDLKKFLKPFPPEVTDLVFWLREFVWDLYPTSNELIYDNYNALAFGWSPSDRVGDTFCSIAVGRTTRNIHFGFYWGAKIEDPKKLLIGEGNQYRYILVKDVKDFPAAYIKSLLKEAYAYSVGKMKKGVDYPKGSTITKSISPVKRLKNKPAVKKSVKKTVVKRKK